MSNCKWPFVITKFLVKQLREACEIFTCRLSNDKATPYAMLEIDEITPAIPVDRAKVSFRLHVHNNYIGNQEALSISQKIISILTGKAFDLVDDETSIRARVRFKYIGKEHNEHAYKFDGLIRQIGG
ncbi:MAG: hypothetical protein LBJ03_02110 [Holosporales bacterium]|jgi:hypothetical protein|nr:hypothetical protein [Holosporales bacterium]